MQKKSAIVHANTIRDQWPKKKGGRKKDLEACVKALMRNPKAMSRLCDFIRACKDIPKDNVNWCPSLFSMCDNYIDDTEEEWKEFLEERSRMLNEKRQIKNTGKTVATRDGKFNSAGFRREGPSDGRTIKEKNQSKGRLF